MAYQITEACTGCTLCARKCPVEAISGVRKEQHHIDPAACIECGVCGRVCAFHAILNADGQEAQRQRTEDWQKPVWAIKDCVYCNICVERCPTGSISLWRNGTHAEAQVYPMQAPYLANPETCIACAFCARDCPTGCISMQKQELTVG
ncbi:MAG TPA: 4Fe-4S binding protein [Anaerolineaceae bacterium]|nr:4Fe-4S binding protein [Anaerolineaceae bacterium]